MISLAVVTVSLVRARFLIEVIVLSSVYSALLTAIFVSLDALDVAMTEAAVGVGVTTTLFLATLKLVGNNADSFKQVSFISLFISLGVAFLLVIGIAGLMIKKLHSLLNRVYFQILDLIKLNTLRMLL